MGVGVFFRDLGVDRATGKLTGILSLLASGIFQAAADRAGHDLHSPVITPPLTSANVLLVWVAVVHHAEERIDRIANVMSPLILRSGLGQKFRRQLLLSLMNPRHQSCT